MTQDAAIRALIAKFRDYATSERHSLEKTNTVTGTAFLQGTQSTYEICADELEAVLASSSTPTPQDRLDRPPQPACPKCGLRGWLMETGDPNLVHCAKCQNDSTRAQFLSSPLGVAPTPTQDDWLESREFYEVMYAYRTAPPWDNSATLSAFEAVKSFVRAASLSAPASRPEPTNIGKREIGESGQPRIVCPHCDMVLWDADDPDPPSASRPEPTLADEWRDQLTHIESRVGTDQELPTDRENARYLRRRLGIEAPPTAKSDSK